MQIQNKTSDSQRFFSSTKASAALPHEIRPTSKTGRPLARTACMFLEPTSGFEPLTYALRVIRKASSEAIFTYKYEHLNAI